MKLARVTSRGGTTIPKSVREACGIQAGDKRIVMTKLEATELAFFRKEYLQSLETTLEEWLTLEDEAAYRHP